MSVRRLVALSVLPVFALLGAAACTVEGAGSKADCAPSGCTVTFDRGVNAKARILGVDAELVAVNGNTVTLRVGNQEVSVPAGDSQPAEGLSVQVQEITSDKVVVKLATGITAS